VAAAGVVAPPDRLADRFPAMPETPVAAALPPDYPDVTLLTRIRAALEARL
jgi:hypothetical protein